MKSTTDALVEALEACIDAYAVPSTACKERPAYEKAIAALALARAEQAELVAAQPHWEVFPPATCDSRELCEAGRSCAGRYGTIQQCAPAAPAPVPQPVQVEPDGWVCVPRQPTQEMIEAALDSMDGSNAPEDDAANMFDAMIAAAEMTR